MELQDIRKLVHADMANVDKLIISQLQSDVVLINQIGHYIVNNGGKRMRPLLLLLTAKLLNYQGNQHITQAAVVEFIHTATLLHDDVVDESALRRGKKTANNLWGNAPSVLVGDFLYSRAFQLMVQSDSLQILDVMADTTNTIAEGEVLQLLSTNDLETTEQKYLDIIQRKTAKLFEAAAKVGAILSRATKEEEIALGQYGLYLGMAFQIVDDLLDYTGDSASLGKNPGDDLTEGKLTLPLIYMLKHGTKETKDLIQGVFNNKASSQDINDFKQHIIDSKADQYTLQTANQLVDKAVTVLQGFEQNPYNDALQALAKMAVCRNC